MTVSRRELLQGIGAGGFVWFTRHAWVSQVDTLQQVIYEQIGERNIGVDIARLVRNENSADEIFRVGINQDELRPTASCFKAWVVHYYYTLTPPEVWADDEGTDMHNVIANSHNVATGRLIQEVGKYQNFGNDIEKFNDFLIYGLNLEHGIASWNWAGNPLVGFVDERFASGGERMVRSRGELHAIGNVTTAADTLNGYKSLYRHTFATDSDIFTGDVKRRRKAALRTMKMLSLPSDGDYLSALERVVGRGVYIGKDGVLPADSTTAGRVINDAGLIPMENGMYAISFFSVAESEFSAIEILRILVDTMYTVERDLIL